MIIGKIKIQGLLTVLCAEGFIVVGDEEVLQRPPELCVVSA